MSERISKEVQVKLNTLADPRFLQTVRSVSKERLPAKAAYWLTKTINKINSHIEQYDMTRIDALKKYSKLKEDGNLDVDEHGNAVFLNEENGKKFSEELQGLLDQEVEIYSISIDSIGDECLLSATDMAVLEELFY